MLSIISKNNKEGYYNEEKKIPLIFHFIHGKNGLNCFDPYIFISYLVPCPATVLPINVSTLRAQLKGFHHECISKSYISLKALTEWFEYLFSFKFPYTKASFNDELPKNKFITLFCPTKCSPNDPIPDKSILSKPLLAVHCHQYLKDLLL